MDHSEYISPSSYSFDEKELPNPGTYSSLSYPPHPLASSIEHAEVFATEPQSINRYLCYSRHSQSIDDSAENEKAKVVSNLHAAEHQLEFLLSSPSVKFTQRNVNHNEYESDIDSFITAISFTPSENIGQLESDDSIDIDKSYLDERGQFMMSMNDYEEIGSVTSSISQSLEIDNNDAIEGHHASGLYSVLIAEDKVDDYLCDILIACGFEIDATKERAIESSESVHSVDGGLGISNIRKEAMYSLNYSLGTSSTSIGVPLNLTQNQKPASASMPFEQQSSEHHDLNIYTPVTNNSVALNSGYISSLSQTSIVHPLFCECGRIVESPIIAPASAARLKNSRHQRPFRLPSYIDRLQQLESQEHQILNSSQSSPPPSSITPSYVTPLLSLIPLSYRESFNFWRNSLIAPSYVSLLSSYIYTSNGSDKEDKNDFMRDRPGLLPTVTKPVITVDGTSTYPKNRHPLKLDHKFNIRYHGIATAEHLTNLVVSTSQTTLDYVKGTIAPSAIHLAHRSASSTINFLTSHIPVSSAIRSVYGRLFRDTVPNRQTEVTATEHESENGGRMARPLPNIERRGLVEHRSQSAPYLTVHLSHRELSVPEMIYHPSHHTAHSSKNRSNSVELMTINQPRGARCHSLQVIPGPEGLDPETRRRLEAQGLASLGLRNETAGRKWRNWWDPRRYGLPKYIIFNQIRTPRPCTIILLLMLIVCIVCRYT